MSRSRVAGLCNLECTLWKTSQGSPVRGGDVNLTGTPWILGSVVVKGTSNWNFSAGNAGILYSKDVLTTYLSRSMPCLILSWPEM